MAKIRRRPVTQRRWIELSDSRIGAFCVARRGNDPREISFEIRSDIYIYQIDMCEKEMIELSDWFNDLRSAEPQASRPTRQQQGRRR
jgi:hypothetical protein